MISSGCQADELRRSRTHRRPVIIGIAAEDAALPAEEEGMYQG